MDKTTAKNYFENKITAQPFEKAAPAISVPDVTPTVTAPAYGEKDLAIYHTYERPFKIFAAITAMPICLAILVTIALTVYKGTQNPKYFPVLFNLIIIMITTGIVYFWYFWGTMRYTLIWYIIIYALLTVLQCVCIVVFVMADNSLPPAPTPVTTHTIPFFTINNTNTTNHTTPRLLFTTSQPTKLDFS